MVTSLARREEAFEPDELVAWLRRRVGEALLDVVDEAETRTFVLTTDVWVEAARALKEEQRLAFTMFDCLFGVDAGADGFDVIAILYSVETGQRVLLKCRADGGRDTPEVPTLTGVYAGADWHERETWDMFGVEFPGHRGLAPRILCAENFEGWPLRKDFHLATREAKPWPGIKEPAELDADGNIIEKVPGIGEAVGPMPLDELMAEQARAANPDLVAAQEAAEQARADAAAAAEQAALEAEQVQAEPVMKDADDVRAEAAEARARRAEEIAADGPVGGGADVADVPAGDPSAFEIDGSGEAPEHRGPAQADTGDGGAVPDVDDRQDDQ
jgi:NADH-quinone oxidoreductase subunit C